MGAKGGEKYKSVLRAWFLVLSSSFEESLRSGKYEKGLKRSSIAISKWFPAQQVPSTKNQARRTKNAISL